MSRKQTEQARQFQQIIHKLRAARIHFTLTTHREDALSILATVPGERWEIDVLDDGEVDFERFVSGGEIEDAAALDALIPRYAETNAGATDR